MLHRIISSILSTVLILGLTSSSSYAYDKPANNSASFSGKVDVGNYSMFIDVKGKRKHGLPTVVFENGNGDSHEIWNKVAPEIAKITRVVTYDRIGIGQSDSPDRRKVDYTAAGEVQRLHNLLKNAGVNGPIVFAVHSIGGLYAREYQYLHPDEVKGIIFIDSATEYAEKCLFKELDHKAQLEIITQDLSCGTGIPIELDTKDILISYNQICKAQATDPLRNLPIEVLSGANHHFPATMPNLEARWASRQAYIASLSNRSIHRIDANNGHYLHKDNPTFVINGIKELLAKLKPIHVTKKILH
ncbi:alpha/beta fold hydrolase [Pseudobacteroides cellulosolvens]|uniref:AB hydrolase-1 domain-containing protein n=1 Tax=Pseudobacteroides cellulosolvens ATCC 35603 = DSM 2933 TaxID=398512 RepID=A0A0L6JSR7_9FIRM|nr:alpha/beta hydrolase [Pseudobacteroides cellulosolvens]KNY28729.1 hypothetical protein Bccel_4003 [Pseudobacteroides cellulosolvens ATCC 35603 = DSM 2933]